MYLIPMSLIPMSVIPMSLTSMHLGIASGDRPLDAKPLGTRSNYLINVASYQNGIDETAQ